MMKRTVAWSLGVLSLLAATAWGGSAASAPGKTAIAAPAKASKAKPALSAGNLLASGSLQATVAPEAAPVPAAPKPALADAFIAQTILRVYLNRPASIFVYNSRGQQVYRLDSQRAVEAVPLQGISTGFVYLTVRTAQGETTKKLVFTGK